jgi:hypothetical protein
VVTLLFTGWQIVPAVISGVSNEWAKQRYF